MFESKKIFFAFGFFLFFLFNFFYPVLAQESFVIVNSKDWKDIISGGVYAGQNHHSYIFVLTPEQAEYIYSFFQNSNNPFYYFESSNPVDENLGKSLSVLQNGKTEKQSNLAEFFSKKSSGRGAVVVDSEFGVDAVSVAPYAVFKNWSLVFATKENVVDIIKKLKAEGKEVLVYGEIAKELSVDIFVEKVIDTGSIYLNNLELLKLFESQTQIVQVVFTSGKTYEPFITKGYPVVLVGRTEPSKPLINWLLSRSSIKGIVFSGDEDITGAIQSIKKETGITVFNKLGTGFSRDAKVKPNMVLDLPSKNVILVLDPPVYDLSSSELKLKVSNIGNVVSYVQLVVELPNGRFIGSPKKEINTNSSYFFSLPISADGLSKNIEKVRIHAYSSSEQNIVESVDIVEFLNVLMQHEATEQPLSSSPSKSTPSISFNEQQNITDNFQTNYYNWIFAIIILILIVIIYYQGKEQIARFSKEKKSRKAGKNK